MHAHYWGTQQGLQVVWRRAGPTGLGPYSPGFNLFHHTVSALS